MSVIVIRKGATFKLVTRWEQETIRYVPITGVTCDAPVALTAQVHQMPDGWRFAVSGIKGGGSALNYKGAIPKPREYFRGTVIDEDTISINAVNGKAWAAYASGGVLQYRLPVSLAEATAKLQVRELDNSSSPVLLELTEQDGIEISGDGKAIVTFDADDTAGISADSAYFDMEITLPTGVVLAYPKTAVRFTSEITR